MTPVLILVISLISVTQSQESCPPTPVNFKQLFINHCNDIILKNTTENITDSVNITDCASVWETFSGAFAGILSEDVKPSNYDDYLNLFPITPDQDTSLFWSRTPKLAEMLSCMCSGADLTSSASITSNEILNGVDVSIGDRDLRWCGTNDPLSSDGIEYVNDCSCGVSFDFFERFSMRFAEAASGTIFYLGYGEREGGTYSSSSFFSRFEVTNFNANVTDAVILVVHRRGKGEYCEQGSLNNLEDDLSDNNITITACYNIFGDISDPEELESMTECAVNIILSTQEGLEPEADDCFSTETGGAVTLQVSVLIMAISVIIFVFLV